MNQNDPGEKLDVRRVHGQIWRERGEPSELLRRTPAWLKHVYMILFLWGLWYVISFSGGFRWDQYGETRFILSREETSGKTGAADPAAVQAPGKPASYDPVAAGQTVYQANCAACHQVTGQGVPGAFPPLAGSDWVSGDERRLILLVLHGLLGPIEVNGVPYNGVMPGWSASLSDRQIADVLSYVREKWGEGAPVVAEERVAELREAFDEHEPWTLETLNALPPD